MFSKKEIQGLTDYICLIKNGIENIIRGGQYNAVIPCTITYTMIQLIFGRGGGVTHLGNMYIIQEIQKWFI